MVWIVSTPSPGCFVLMLSEVEEFQQAESTAAADCDYLVVGQQQVPRSSSTSDITERLYSDSSQGMYVEASVACLTGGLIVRTGSPSFSVAGPRLSLLTRLTSNLQVPPVSVQVQRLIVTESSVISTKP